jgi:hypothetical protein
VSRGIYNREVGVGVEVEFGKGNIIQIQVIHMHLSYMEGHRATRLVSSSISRNTDDGGEHVQPSCTGPSLIRLLT